MRRRSDGRATSSWAHSRRRDNRCVASRSREGGRHGRRNRESESGTGDVVAGIPGDGSDGPGGLPGPNMDPDTGPPEFNEAMTPPRKISGPEPEYTREALEREIQGTMVVKCVVTRQGTVRNC